MWNLLLKTAGMFVALLIIGLFVGEVVSAGPYGRGAYGTCTFGDTCSISIATSSTVNLSIEPTVAGAFTVDKDEITVTTNNQSGYSVTLESSSDSNNSLIGSIDELTAVAGTPDTPAELTGNEWGYRIDGFSGFGDGPTSAVENQASVSLTFAGVPLLGDAATIKSSLSDAPDGETTEVWYGARADFDVAPGTYSQTVVYTAVTL